MSARNQGLFLPGHIEVSQLEPILRPLLGGAAAAIHHGERRGLRFTHIGVPALEASGLVLMDRAGVPEQDLEMRLGRELSRRFGQALFLQFDDETGWGGHARFVDGALASLDAVDGRPLSPLRRTLEGARALTELDPSEWIWPELADAVERGAAALLGPGIRSDDDIAALIGAAAPAPRPAPGGEGAPPQIRPQDDGEEGRMKRLINRIKGR